jgi:imidazole glycerol-phosphate synthase subunit HisH
MNILSDNVVIIDYQMGNLRSVQKAFEANNCNAIISNQHDIIKNADKIILPGVGSFKDGMRHLNDLNLIGILNQEIISNKKPFLGICLGMHLIADKGYENGQTSGLSWLDAEVVKLKPTSKNLNIPHVGWNNVTYRKRNELYKDVEDNHDFYFVHSYHLKTTEDVVSSTTNYGIDFISSIKKDNIYAFQFHPEKSQTSGLKIIKNFINVKV